ncbi:MAG: hypothetical protein DSM106950_02690 [Stigonema ocellatum SAG 48.90 = DSM 106950]|nr:hypothetical protein [Stigonema ocellatum SAG 48.90 = DSM 106950]
MSATLTNELADQIIKEIDDICEQSWQVIETHTQSELVNQTVSFRTEKQWMNQVHQSEDSLCAERRKNKHAEFSRRFHNRAISF